jgi:hypothetical protein
MLNVLQLDPRAYLVCSTEYPMFFCLFQFLQQHQDTCMQVFLESIVTAKVTVEHEYLTLLFHIDGFQHPLLLGAAGIWPSKTMLPMSVSDFLEIRLPITRGGCICIHLGCI